MEPSNEPHPNSDGNPDRRSPDALTDFMDSLEDGRMGARIGGVICTADVLRAKFRALVLGFFEPVSACVPPEVIAEWFPIDPCMVRDQHQDPDRVEFEVDCMRDLYEQASTVRRLLLLQADLLKIKVLPFLSNPAWLERCWEERLTHFNLDDQQLEDENAFNQTPLHLLQGSSTDGTIEALGAEVPQVTLQDVVTKSLVAQMKRPVIHHWHMLEIMELLALVRVSSACERSRLVNEQLQSWRKATTDSVDGCWLETFSQQALAHFVPGLEPTDLHASLALLAGHAVQQSQDGMQRFLATCRNQSTLAFQLNRLVPPRWLIGLLRLHLGASEILAACPILTICRWNDLADVVRSATPGAFLVDLRHHSLMLCKRVAEARQERFGYFDPDRGYVECDMRQGGPATLLMSVQRGFRALHPQLNSSNPSCVVRRIDIPKQDIREFCLDDLVDWQGSEPN
ncbi:hypothetical protein VARIO8X_120300 [Burkholderiales bacterium 8X]|nr:hypothetical protein VARIO8X_120300 [Burkholderiales bacterium 8X]